MSALFGLVLICLSFVLGAFGLLGYVIWRMLRSDGWDDSNILNALRVISHVAIHPEDLAQLRYPSGARPFWYVRLDEFEGVVRSRPVEPSDSLEVGLRRIYRKGAAAGGEAWEIAKASLLEAGKELD